MATKNHENTLFKVITSCRGYITKRRDYRYKTSGLPLQNVGVTLQNVGVTLQNVGVTHLQTTYLRWVLGAENRQ